MKRLFPLFGLPSTIVAVIPMSMAGLIILFPLFAQRGITYTVSVTNRVNVIFNADWKSYQGDMNDPQAAAFDDSGWTYVDLPHANKFVMPEDRRPTSLSKTHVTEYIHDPFFV